MAVFGVPVLDEDAAMWAAARPPGYARGSRYSTVELKVIDWLRTWLGMPTGTAAGVLVTGGYAANLPALLVACQPARGPSGDSVVCQSDQATISRPYLVSHGLRPQQMRGAQLSCGFRAL